LLASAERVRFRLVTTSVSTWALALLTLAVVLLVVATAGMKVVSDDLLASLSQAQDEALSAPRTPPRTWLSAWVAANLNSADAQGRRELADQLSHRGERLREFASVVALLGVFFALLSGSSVPSARDRARARNPAANTTSNGTV
jgi:hypothetical protein